MGGTLSMCGLGASADHDPQLHYQRKDFNSSDLERPSDSRGRSLSAATDSSVASILSNSEQLIPDAFLPKDIQVLSQRRQRHGPHHMSSRSSNAYSGKNSRVSNSSERGAGTLRVVLNTVDDDSVSKTFAYGIKTASSSFGYSDDEPAAIANRRADNNSLSVQELRVK